MSIGEAIETLDSRFTSGNNVPVKQARITAEEWRAIKEGIDASNKRYVDACAQHNEECDEHDASREMLREAWEALNEMFEAFRYSANTEAKLRAAGHAGHVLVKHGVRQP